MHTLAQVEAYLPTRDLRYYGITQVAWTVNEQRAMAAEAAARPVEDIDNALAGFRMAIPHLDEMTLCEMLAKLHNCPPRPEGA